MAVRTQLSSPPDANGHRALHDVNENTPLLAVDDVVPAIEARISEATTLNDDESNDAPEDDRPLPRLQLFLLCFSRWLESVAFFSIVPYINEMVEKNGKLSNADAGFYSGIIESVFSLTQMFVMLFWGKAADRFGRKPVLVVSIVGVALATSIFGLATSIWQMVLFRCIAGVFAGTVVTVRTMIGEISTAKTSARAFSYFAFMGNLGIMVGPLIGGVFVDPAKQYPRLFGGVKFFVDYPYALPSFIISIIGLAIAALCAIFVEETLPPSKRAHNSGDETGDAKRLRSSTWDLVKAPGVGLILYTYNHVMLLAFAFTMIAPLFWYTKVSLGGLGYTPVQISLWMGYNGFCQALWILLVFPPLQHRIGTRAVLRVCALAYPIFFILMPTLNVLLRMDSPAATRAFWIFMPLASGLGCGVSMSFVAIQLALNDAAPTQQMLGTLNALCLSLTSGTRAFAPALFASLYAVGARTQWLDGYAIWILMALLAGGFTVLSRYLPDYEEMKKKREQEVATEQADARR